MFRVCWDGLLSALQYKQFKKNILQYKSEEKQVSEWLCPLLKEKGLILTQNEQLDSPIIAYLVVVDHLRSVTDVLGSDIGVKDGKLYLYGKEYKFVGWNAYTIAIMWVINASCDDKFRDQQLDVMFSALPSDSLVRWEQISATACSYDTWLGDDVIDIVINYPAKNKWPT